MYEAGSTSSLLTFRVGRAALHVQIIFLCFLGESKIFTAKDSGPPNFKVTSSMFSAPVRIELKVGAQVSALGIYSTHMRTVPD